MTSLQSMPESRGRTIQIYLPNGDPRGIRIAEITTRTVQTLLVPQSHLKLAKSRSELAQIAVYFLFGESDDLERPICYIGQTENVAKRLDRHSNSKSFWNVAVVAVSKTQAFTPAHIRWLEWHCVKKASEIDRYVLDNDQNPGEPYLTESLRDDCLDAFETISTLLTALGHPLFEPIVQMGMQEMFYISGPNAEGKGVLSDDGFIVRKGSLCRKEFTDSGKNWKVDAQRNSLVDAGVLGDHNQDQFIFLEDYLFDTPSGAARVVLARSSNGWTDWKNKKGQTLHDVKRATDPTEEDE